MKTMPAFTLNPSAKVDFLQAEWLAASGRIDALPWVVPGEKQAGAEVDMEDCEKIEEALFSVPARCAEDAAFKMAIIARCIRDGAQACHVVELFDKLRPDLERFAGASL